MKNTIFRLTFIAVLIFTIQSCKYLPPEIPLTEVSKPSDIAPQIGIDLKPDMDTLKLTTPVNVNYTVDVGNLNLYNIEFFLDGNKVENMNYISSKSVYINIPVQNMSDGMHFLKVVTYTSTNSRSIADKVKAEQYSYVLTWPIFINKEARDNYKITKFESTPEGILIGWNKYDFHDFKNYELTRYSGITGKSTILLNTSDPKQNSILEKGYLEGDYYYYSFTMNSDLGFFSDSKTYVEEIKKPIVTINSDRTFSVNWKSSNHPQNQKSYFLNTIYPQYGYPEEKEILDLNQTFATFAGQLGFGGNYAIQLRYIPKDYEGYNTFNVKGGLTNFALGDSISAFERGFFIDGTSLIITYLNGKFSTYNFSTGQSSASFSIKSIESVYQRYITFSVSGKLFGYFEDQQFVVRNSSDWSLVKKMDIEAYSSFNLNTKSISLSDNGVVALVDNSNKLRIFNFQTGIKILEMQYNNTFFLQNAILSTDGKSVCMQIGNYSAGSTSIISYAIESGQLKETGSYTKPGNDYESIYSFSPVSGKIIYFNYLGMYNYKVEIINPQTCKVENSVTLTSQFVPITYDYVNDRVIAQYQSFPIKKFSYIIDVKTGKRNSIVQFIGREQFLFSNGTVYAGNGRSIKIEDFIIE